jgi:hypothetical protein
MHIDKKSNVDGVVRPILASWEEEAWAEAVSAVVQRIAAEQRQPVEVIANGREVARLYKTGGRPPHPAVVKRAKHLRPR